LTNIRLYAQYEFCRHTLPGPDLGCPAFPSRSGEGSPFWGPQLR